MAKGQLTVALVETGNYLGRGAEYVARMCGMLRRNLSVPYEIVCLSDREHAGILCVPVDANGWWSKVHLFRPGLFTGRVLYLDLDSVITGSLDEYAGVTGIIDLHDWGWRTHTYGSGVMVWDAGDHADIWTKFSPSVQSRLRGDQDWMTELGGWDPLPKPWQQSYRYVSVAKPPPGCKIVCFHGAPKMHQLQLSHWVHRYWKE